MKLRAFILFIGMATGIAVMVFGAREGSGGAALAGSGADDNLLAKRAEAMALSCAACHGTGGELRTEIPPLAGQPELVLRAQLLAFQRDEFPGATVMPRLAKGYTEEELAAIARYFASLEPAAGR